VSQPPPYNRSFSFVNFQATNPSTPLPASPLEQEFNNAKATLDAVLANLVLIQRDDGALKNASVGLDQLKAEVPVGFNVPVVWTTATAYTANSSTVFNGAGFYRCLVSHTSGTFATDLAAGKWQLIADLSSVPLKNASQITVTPSGSLTSDVQTSLQALDAGKALTSHTHPSSAISDSTAAGRALLTAADATAQNVLLGTTLLGFRPGMIAETAEIVLPSGWYYCDGSAKNRVTDANLFNAISIQQSGVLVSGSAVVTGLSDTSSMSPGMPLSGTGIPASTVIQSVDSGTQITMSQTATSSGTTPVVVAPYGVGDGSTTFNLPNRSYIAVGRDNMSGSASNVIQISTNLSLTSGSSSATVGSATGLCVGMFIAHPKVPFGTTITAISGTTITMSANALATNSSTGRFSPIKEAQTLGQVGGALAQTLALAQIPTGITSANTGAITVNVTGNQTVTKQGSGFGIAGTATVQIGNDIIPTATGTLAIGAVPVTSNNTGGQGHINVQPTTVMNFIIKR